MKKPVNVKAIFFDSGNTLMRPVDDRWFPGMRFFDICSSFGQPVADDAMLERACAAGYRYLDAHHREVPDEAAEVRQFSDYYRLIFRSLGRPIDGELVSRLAAAMVNDVNFEPYPETKHVLEAVDRLGIRMAVLTDAWPSVRSKYKSLGYLHYFDAFVISAEVACLKPDMGMFRPALKAIGVTPREVLFIDDGLDLVEAARRNGFAALLADYDDRYPHVAERITDLRQVLDYVTP